jgi:hypothetical protein
MSCSEAKTSSFRKTTNLTGWDWFNVFVIPSEGFNMPEEWNIRQRWKFGVDAAEGFVSESAGESLVVEGESMGEDAKGMPGDLEDKLR